MAVFPAGHILTSADIDTMFPTGLGAWQPYTPVWGATTTNPTLGNGSLIGAYQKIGRGVWFRYALTLGSTSTVGTGAAYTFTFPVPANGAMGQSWLGGAAIVDASAGVRNIRQAFLQSTTTFSLMTEAGVLVSPTAPWAWAVSDTIVGEGFYEAAS